MRNKDNKVSKRVPKLLIFFVLVLFLILTGSLFIIIRFNDKSYIKSDNASVNVLAANEIKIEEEKTLSQLPVLKEGVVFPILTARSVMAIDLDSGVSLYEKDSNVESLPASTTKIMTAIIAMEYFDPAYQIVVKENGVIGQKMGLKIGETMTVDNLIRGLLIASANDAAEVLARNYEGGRDAFIEKMNDKVIKLRLTNTFFKNPTGLDEDGQTTTAKDLMKLATYAMQKPYFAEIVGTKYTEVRSTDGKFSHRLINTNELLGKVDGVLGTKTGWTENARENLVAYVERNGKKVIVVLLGSQNRFGESEELIEWIFDSYDWIEVDPVI